MNLPKKFSCVECGGAVRSRTGRGRTREYRTGLPLPVPDDFPILTCSSCGETYLSEDDDKRLDAAQKPAYLQWQRQHLSEVIATIQYKKPDLSLRALERACGVTPSYLSHVSKGRRVASATLIHLLEAYAVYPAELERHIERRPWSAALTPPTGSRQQVTYRFSEGDALEGTSPRPRLVVSSAPSAYQMHLGPPQNDTTPLSVLA